MGTLQKKLASCGFRMVDLCFFVFFFFWLRSGYKGRRDVGVCVLEEWLSSGIHTRIHRHTHTILGAWRSRGWTVDRLALSGAEIAYSNAKFFSCLIV